ncbi:MAG: hypothetical protein WBC13_00855 [Dokdonella sp.]
MPHTLSLTDGTTTVSLTTSGIALTNYTPNTPKNGAAITEPIRVLFYGDTTADMQGKINAIERLFSIAERRLMSGAGARVFLQFQPIGDATNWRSEVLSGTVMLDKDALTAFGQAKLEAEIVVVRAPYWEGARTQIPLTNPNGTNNTAGLTINNGSTNYADIGAASVVGALPAPLEVRLRNTSGASRGYRGFHIATNTFAQTVDHHIEGEERTNGRPTLAVTGASGGSVVVVENTTPIDIAFTLPAAMLSAYTGRWARLLVRCTSLYGGGQTLYGWAQVYDNTGFSPIYRTPAITLSNTQIMQDFGMIPLPPGGANGGNWAAMTLRLWFKGGATLSVGVDYLAFAPAEDRFYRYFVQRGMVVLNNDWLVDDGIEGQQYLIEAGANHPIYATMTPPAYVVPATNQRLYVWQEGSGVRADWTMQVQAFYRPRRSTL